MFLVDTNIISEGASSRRTANHDLIAWLAAHPSELFLSVITIAELEAGIAKAHRQGASAKALALASWLNVVIGVYGDKILPVDLEIARIAGLLRDKAVGSGHNPDSNDVLIAATAAHHRLTVLTRNLKHFKPFGVAALDPMAAP